MRRITLRLATAAVAVGLTCATAGPALAADGGSGGVLSSVLPGADGPFAGTLGGVDALGPVGVDGAAGQLGDILSQVGDLPAAL